MVKPRTLGLAKRNFVGRCRIFTMIRKPRLSFQMQTRFDRRRCDHFSARQPTFCTMHGKLKGNVLFAVACESLGVGHRRNAGQGNATKVSVEQ